ncbi:hypothetical protein PR003_g24658 [Phytophthora rubi]|uniref:RxLR effector protein n=1 Tax=Phytophthora rubi TaxID=129364 RepID=A0A6A3ICP0_9STRA|nr:hypothetical protein PR002_g25702 [Phytophthora rubi]KAE8977824.1 hypothetical protein PR001_g25022 [Phytophthora rubi]KAE9292827.1 hypothetical protein PR003_g24658 [Phytophthora rubi]
MLILGYKLPILFLLSGAHQGPGSSKTSCKSIRTATFTLSKKMLGWIRRCGRSTSKSY